MEKWEEGVRDLAKFSKKHPQKAYTGLGVSLKLKGQYLQRNVPGSGALMEIIESVLRVGFFPSLFGGEEVDDSLRELLRHVVNQVGIGIPYPRKLA